MQSADLLALAASSAPRTAPPAASPEDGDAFARALDNEVGRSRPEDQPRCGTTGEAASEAAPVRGDRPHGVRDAIRDDLGERPDRAAFSGWRDFLQSLREAGVLPGQTPAEAAAKPTSATALTAPTEGSTPKPAPKGPFQAALDALGAAITAAVQDPAANPAQPGQLPPAVQAALDVAIAAAPPALQPRLQAFATRLAERLAAAMAGAGEGTAKTAPAVSETGKPARPAQSVAQAVLAALGEAGQTANPAMPDLEAREARAAAAPVAAAPAEPEATTPAAPAATAAPSGDTAKAAPAAEAKTAPVETAAEPVAAAATAEARAAEATPQAASATPTASTTQTHAAALTATRGAPDLAAQMAATISRKLEGRTTRFNMELNPAELGRVDVRLSIDKDGRIAAQMAFDNPVAAADMRGKADELRRQLEQSGFQVASEDLTFTDRETSQGFNGNARGQLADPEVARDRAFREAERTARLAEDAGRLHNRAVIGLDMKV